jgi:hypothetical protein
MDRFDVLVERPSLVDEVLERGVVRRSRHCPDQLKGGREVAPDARTYSSTRQAFPTLAVFWLRG